MSGPEFFQTQMGRQFYENTMPEIVKALNRIATAMEKKRLKISGTEKDLGWRVAVVFSKENILKYTSEDELFALFHTFKEYYNENRKVPLDYPFEPLDEQIGETIKRLKANYK